MPNHVYSTIIVHNDNNLDKLKEIAKVGLARYYKPMPTELEGTTAPPRVGDTVTQEIFDELKDKYGHADWYSWSNANWGTKWGCYDNQLDDTIYRFTTAWSPLDVELIEMFAKDFPNFTYEWEEEQGFGLNAECEDGEISIQEEWDIPSVEEVYDENDEELDIYFLSEEHRGKEVGYYDSWSLEEYLGATKEEALQNI